MEEACVILRHVVNFSEFCACVALGQVESPLQCAPPWLLHKGFQTGSGWSPQWRAGAKTLNKESRILVQVSMAIATSLA